jgi:Zn-dependent metalloprotease
LSSAGQFKKSADHGSEHPFQSKLRRQQVDINNSGKHEAFRKTIEGLSENMIISRARAAGRALSLDQQTIQHLQEISAGTLKMTWSEKGTVPIFIRGERLQQDDPAQGARVAVRPAESQVASFLNENRQLLRIVEPSEELRLIERATDRYGLTHLRYQQTYKGLDIWGRDLRVHLNQDGFVDSFNGRYIPTPHLIQVANSAISQSAAENIARQHLGKPVNEPGSRKLIYVDDFEQPHVAWLVQMKGGLAENWHYFVDAQTGDILKYYNHIMTDGPVAGSGADLFDQTRNLNLYQIGSDFLMTDASKPMFDAGKSTMPQDGKGVIYTLDARNADSTLFFVTSIDANSWNDKAAVSASANGALVYDFYNQVFNRNAIDGKGSTMNVVVNYSQNYNNAFWNGQLMVFGNGDGTAFSDLAAAIDVTAHEMSHGVIERTANLVYENQSGALNESFADVFGVLFEFWVLGENGNWFLGEDVTTPNIAGDVLRNMENPAAANVAFNGQQPTKMSEFRNLANTPQEDNGGVHINSGIPNRAFFLFANDPAVGRDKAGEVYYQALTNYLTRNAQFIDCRLAVLKAVDDVFGAGTPAATAAANAAAMAFDTVEIFDGNSTPPPPTQDPVQGQEFVTAIDAESGLLYRYDPATQEIVQISTNGLFSRPSVTDDGAFILYVDDANNVHVLTSDGSSDQQVTTSGGFSNIAISPDGRFLAATSTFTEPVIYVLDLNDVSGASDKQIEL